MGVALQSEWLVDGCPVIKVHAVIPDINRYGRDCLGRRFPVFVLNIGMDFYKKVEEKISIAFGKYGILVCRNPWSTIMFSILLNGLLGINIMWITSEKDLLQLYTPTNSQADQDQERVKQLFPDRSHDNFFYHTLPNLGYYGNVIFMAKENIVNKDYVNEVQSLYDYVKEIRVTASDGHVFKYEDLCARRNNKCVVDGDIFLASKFWELYNSKKLPYPLYVDQMAFERYHIDRIFGGAIHEYGKLISAPALKMTFHLRQDTPDFTELSKQWELKYIEALLKYKTNRTEISFSYSDSLSQELDANTYGDISLFSLTFTIMITYASFATAGGNWLTQRGHLGRAGVLATALAILGSFGLCSAAHLKYVNMVGIMPFLIVGIGVDDMFILLSGLADAPLRGSVEERISHTMRTSGVAITITSLTDLIAFFIGTLSVFMSVRNFCIYTGTAVVLCYVNQITFFLACMVLHEKRVAAGRHCVTCQPVFSSTEMKKVGITNKCLLICCSGRPAESREETQSFIEMLPARILPKLVLNLPAKIIILVLTVAYLGCSIYGASQLEQGLVLKNLVSEDSYYYRYSTWNSDYYPLQIPISFVLPEQLDYRSPEVYEQIESLVDMAVMDDDVADGLYVNWLSEFLKSGTADNSTEETFYVSLKDFLGYAPSLRNDIIFDSTGSKIVSSRFYLITRTIRRSYSQGKLMERMREVAKASSLNVFSFTPAFIYFEQYVAVLPNTLQTVGVAIAAVFVVTCVLMPHPFMIFLVTFSIVSIMLGVFGFMYFWGLSLSCITMIHVIMSVGFSVDFSAHICHAFMSVEGRDRNSKANAAIIRSGGPVFNCAVSSIIGIMTLVFSKSFVFRSFFKVMFLVILFGFVHAVCLLPVLLSLFGPNKKMSNEPKLSMSPSKASLGTHSMSSVSMGKDNFAFTNRSSTSDP